MASKNNSSSVKTLKFAILATDVVCFQIIHNQLSVLLGKVANVPAFAGKWALIGGLIFPDETADQSAERHLLEKSGISNVYKEQLYTFSDVKRDLRGRVVSVAYMALTNKNPQDLNKARLETKWCPVKNLPALAYDHDKIVSCAIERLHSKIGYTNIAQYLLPEEFTMSELQTAYENVLGKGLDKRNFRKKILAGDTLKNTEKTRKQGVMRPATLYRFSTKKSQIVNIL
ncbi:MAG: NUDIX domain-containing protein [Candidatus Pacebacteria bacterium]|nr:NUDIX domain-containing protein [Candidatus Paceibacterota bacterium]